MIYNWPLTKHEVQKLHELQDPNAMLEGGPNSRTSHTAIANYDVESSKHKLRLYPNPNNGSFNVIFNQDKPSTIRITVQDVSGHILIQKENLYGKGNQVLSINESDLSAGVYFLRVETWSDTGILKFIVKN
jgi:hypothetical protein